MKEIKVVSFDMDGTLVDLKFVDLIWHEGIPSLYAKKEEVELQVAKEYVRSEYEKFGEYSLEWYDIKYWFEHFGFSESWEELMNNYEHEIEFYSEVPSLLARLREEYDLVVGSNASREFLDIELRGFEEYFSHLFSSTSDFKQVKKTSEFYANVCETMGVRPEEIVHVGDHWQFDVLAPRELGMTAFYLNRDGKEQHDDTYEFTINDLEGMLRWL
ncbi:MAG: HAD family hydrolase [Halobacteriota archaeon]|nr:HAD family hydrolase [Halobacteriota archaeon]